MSADLTQARVLIADDAPTVRQSVRMTLAQAGIVRADTANSIGETRRRVRSGEYDVVLCDYHFGEGMNGQELLEELRRSGELPLATIWFMITAEASYEKVVAVAEVGPDDYLIKPFTSATLADRLYLAWQKKAFLRPVLDRIHAGDAAGAIDAGMALLPDAGPYRLDLIRVLSNLLLESARLDEARTLFEEILAGKAVPWAKLGLAKVLSRQGCQTQAEGILQAAIESHGQYVDAYEALAALYVAENRMEEAMGIFEKCLTISPNNVSRLQKAGNLANMMGEPKKARQLLERAVVCGGNSSALSAETLLQLALAARREGALGDADKYLRAAQELIKRQDNLTNRAVGKLAAAVFQHRTDPLAEVDPWITDPEFSLETAVGFIMVADIVCPPTLLEEETNPANPPYAWLSRIARRFVTTRHISGMLESAAGSRHVWRDFIQTQGQSITEINRQGVQLMLKQREAEAVALLLPLALETRNHRLTLSAAHALLKHLRRNNLPEAEHRQLLQSVNLLIEQLQGLIDDGVLHNLRDERDALQGQHRL